MTRLLPLVLCLLMLACSPQATPSEAPLSDGADTPTPSSEPEVSVNAKMPGAGEYVALSDPRYGQLDAAASAPIQGEQAPDFELPNHLGGTTRLSEVLAQGPVVLMFYRGFW